MRRTSRRATAISAAGALATLTALSSTSLASAASTEEVPGAGPTQRAKNVILFIGDGMGQTHVDAARIRYQGAAGRLAMEQLPAVGAVKTYAVEEGSDKPDYVTDSASSATAWASGVKTYNSAIGKDSRGNVVPTLMEQAKRRGLRTGNVTTAEITDATPAAMFAHVSSRSCQGPDFDAVACVRESGQGAADRPIAEQIASNDVADVILGGGLQRFEPGDGTLMERNGYRVLGSFGDPALAEQTPESQRVATQNELFGVGDRDARVIGLFNRGNLTVEKYKRENADAAEAQEPSLPEMTEKAIELLRDSRQGQDRGFLLQVEGALIDKRSHANDAAQTLEEIKAFDDAVARAVDFARRDGNTLVVVAADHECAGFNIIGKESYTNAEAVAPPVNVDSGNPANNSTPSREASGALDPERSTGPVNGERSDDAGNFAPATFRTADDPAEVQDGSTEASLWLAYLSGNHTGADVPIYAVGPGSRLFDDAIDNTDIYDYLRGSLRGLR